MSSHPSIDDSGNHRGQALIKKFRTQDRRYFYDAYSNHVLEVDSVVHEVIDHWGTMPAEKIGETLRHVFPIEDIRKALTEISSFSKAGFLRNFRPAALRYHKPFSAIRRDLRTRLEQIVLNLTENCNLRCGYCAYSGRYFHKRSHSPKNMSWDVARKAVDYLLDHSRGRRKISVGFYGGEPFLRFGLFRKTVEYAKRNSGEKRVRFNVTTNGTVMTDAMIDFLAENDIHILVSLDGPKNLHDRYRLFRNGRGTYDTIVETLERILARRESYYRDYVSFNVVIAPPYRPLQIEAFLRNNEKLFQNAQITIGGIDAQGTSFFDGFKKRDLSDREFKILERRCLEDAASGRGAQSGLLRTILMESVLLKIFKRDIGRRMNKYEYPNGACTPGLRRIFVSADGTFHMCEKVNESIPIGNVESGLDPDRIISLMKDYAEKSSPDCRDCWALRLCTLCYVHAVRAGFDMEAKRRNCRTARKTILNSLTLYCQLLEKNPDALAYMKKIVLS